MQAALQTNTHMLDLLQFDKTQPLTLGKLLEYKVMDFKTGISNISNEATQEEALEELLAKVQDKVGWHRVMLRKLWGGQITNRWHESF